VCYSLQLSKVAFSFNLRLYTAGATRADPLACLKVQCLAGETLPQVLEALRRQVTYGY
jgi:hypothetical protein